MIAHTHTHTHTVVVRALIKAIALRDIWSLFLYLTGK